MHAPSEVITVRELGNLVGELRLMARNILLSESGPRSLTPTALAHSALRRAQAADLNWDDVQWESRRHFFGALRKTMGRILIDHARRAKAGMRGKTVYAGWDDTLWADLANGAEKYPELCIALEEAMEILRSSKPEWVEVLELHYYAGYTAQEIVAFSETPTNKKAVDRKLKAGRVALKDTMLRLLARP